MDKRFLVPEASSQADCHYPLQASALNDALRSMSGMTPEQQAAAAAMAAGMQTPEGMAGETSEAASFEYMTRYLINQ